MLIKKTKVVHQGITAKNVEKNSRMQIAFLNFLNLKNYLILAPSNLSFNQAYTNFFSQKIVLNAKSTL